MYPSWREQDRLAALHRYDVLDSDAFFGDFVQIASQVCKAPIAVVNLIDAQRQWFAAEIGLGVRETPLDVSICAHAILQPGVFVVPDLTRDSRFACNPLVTGRPDLRFYGGALLETSEGLPLGTVCVLDYEPRPAGLTEEERFTLQALARQIMAQLELRRLIFEKELLLKEAHHRVSNSLQMVQSLLSLQARRTDDVEAAQQLHISAARVRAFGAMHQHLYSADAAFEVDLAVYLGNLVADQKAASTLPDRDIALHAESVRWPSSDAPSVGLVMLELITNALKYGQGTVTVTLRQQPDHLVLTVEDEGQDLPAAYQPSKGSGLGMSLILGLLQGRQGQLEVDRTRGHTCFVVRMMKSELPRNGG